MNAKLSMRERDRQRFTLMKGVAEAKKIIDAAEVVIAEQDETIAKQRRFIRNMRIANVALLAVTVGLAAFEVLR